MMKIRDILKEQAGQDDLRKIIVSILESIYFAAGSGEDETDRISDSLGDYFQQVKDSGDAVLQSAYADVREMIDAEPEEQAMVALSSIKKLMGANYRPRPVAPLTPQQAAQVNDLLLHGFEKELAKFQADRAIDRARKKPSGGVK